MLRCLLIFESYPQMILGVEVEAPPEYMIAITPDGLEVIMRYGGSYISKQYSVAIYVEDQTVPAA